MITSIMLSILLVSFVVFVVHYEGRFDELRVEREYMKAHIMTLESQIQRLNRELSHK